MGDVVAGTWKCDICAVTRNAVGRGIGLRRGRWLQVELPSGSVVQWFSPGPCLHNIK